MAAIAVPPQAGSFALLTDGSHVRIRRAVPGDWQVVHDFAETLGRESVYRRFFGFPRQPGKIIADAVCAPVPLGAPLTHGALLALVGERMVGLAEWHHVGRDGEAEIAFAVSDDLHGRGVATLLAEHLLDAALAVGLRRLTAITQSDNRAMLDVFTGLGVPTGYTWDEGTWLLSIDLDFDADEREALREAEARREAVADDASLRPVLTPRGVAVIGDPAHAATRAAVANLEAFPGRIATAGADGRDLAEDVALDLAVITSAPPLAVEAARVCAERDIRALIVTATGFDPATGRELLGVCRSAGMRLIGPGSLGIAHPAVGLNATLCDCPIAPGAAGVAVQSGGVGLALLSHLDRLRVGVGAFAGVGDKYDVSANDLLMTWERDPSITFGLLHVASFGNPRKFARTARRLSRRVPLLAVDPEQSPGQARTAVYAQAGITTVPSLGALVAAAALVAHQPAPRGARVGILGNTGGMVALAAAACTAAGLEVTASVNLAPDADSGRLYRALASTAARDTCDALLVALAPTGPQAPGDGLGHDAVPHRIPLFAVLVDQPETVTLQQDVSGRLIPCYNDAAIAADALAAYVAAARRRAASADVPAAPVGIDRSTAHGVVEACLSAERSGSMLSPSQRAALLAAYGIAAVQTLPIAGQFVAAATVTAWQDPLFGPLVSCARGIDPGRGTVVLAPVGIRDATRTASGVLGAASHPAAHLADVLTRVAALVDDFAQVAAVRLTLWADEDQAPHVQANEVSVASGERVNPYLRRLRRAPVE
ncbi:MAG TPA: GNAT family N-acetyltransferase [Actinocrinis sp.]|nr:GNAT family N-acetyltransferase [Actinocrinis sp.]